MSVSFPHVRLGNSGLKISKIIVGCMSYGSKNWASWIEDDEEKVFKILKKLYDSGIRTFDTANVYSNGKSEELLGKFIKKFKIKRDRIVILSKCFFPVRDDDQPANYSDIDIDYINSQGLSRKHIFDAVEASVKRLGTFIDVLQIHRFDPDTPGEEIMRSLNDVIEKGYTRYIGASSMKAYEFIDLQHIAEKHNWHKFISMQNYYNLLNREEEREMIPYCQKNGVGLIPWSPNARGLLTRPLNAETERSKVEKKRFSSLGLTTLETGDKEIISRVENLAEKHKVSMAAVSTAWVLSKDIYPIVGISSEKRVDDLIAAVLVELSKEDVEYLEAPYTPKFSRY
ncbi:aldo/keto reductase [Ascoidea rubescens DSM 1968]|uniref:Aldo/keto reductase n=1 Tax=Ascoidea rubescens DSM 1968 TaxID=1344418 RepID=A0A1D2VII3_9ASCO|nr:Aldo/keto reductase [Ascoidea rubescens DSM 1968]ODV61451.1 Aldo/keto reductase [Ascoidea rubescens DSM 1968]